MSFVKVIISMTKYTQAKRNVIRAPFEYNLQLDSFTKIRDFVIHLVLSFLPPFPHLFVYFYLYLPSLIYSE